MEGENRTAASANGVGFTGLLQILFIALKLTHVIDWKWVWVLAPMWIDAILIVIISVCLLIYYFKTR